MKKDAKFYISEIEKIGVSSSYKDNETFDAYSKIVRDYPANSNEEWVNDKSFIAKLKEILSSLRETSLGWIVTKDYTEEYDGKTFSKVSVIGPRDCLLEKEELIKGHPFKMYDDDKILYYEGFLVGDKTSEEGFSPLEDYGTPNAGCTMIKYLNKGKWELL